MNKILIINKEDNVAVALTNLEAGTVLHEVGTMTTLQAIPAGHKVALRNILAGENVVKYGYPIGAAIKQIKAGEHVHTHNTRTSLGGPLPYSYNPIRLEAETERQESAACFPGYRRRNGKIGVRNEVWIINTVGCCNKVSENLAARASERYRGRRFDGVFQFSHPYGCSQLGEDHLRTQKILAGLVHHPNAAAVLVLGLGCENNHINQFREVVGKTDDLLVCWLNTQDVGDEIETGLLLLDSLVEYAESCHREPVPVSELVVGLKCGGSDAFSGISANPVVGVFADRLLTQGGSALLTEVPEMFGAETILMNRCRNEDVFNQTVDLINDFKNYFQRHKQAVYENPSPGNKDGGITTLEEKSLGCILKGGSTPVNGVISYGQNVYGTGLKGLVLLDGPGNDMVAVTALTAAGAHLILFTTGRGTPLGGPVPTVKIASNSRLSELKKHWIDFDAGRLLAGASLANLGEELYQYVIRVAGGELTKNEHNNYREISIFKDGVTL